MQNKIKILLVLYSIGSFCNGQNLIQPIDGSVHKKWNKYFSKNIELVQDNKKTNFTDFQNGGLLIGQPNIDTSTDFQLGFDMNESGQILWRTKERLKNGEIYKITFDIYIDGSLEVLKSNFIFLKTHLTNFGEEKFICAKPILTNTTNLKKKQWTQVEFFYLGNGLKKDEIVFHYEGSEENEHNYFLIKNYKLARVTDYDENNLIHNGSFELYHFLPNKQVFFGSNYLYKWQEHPKDIKCVQSRDNHSKVNAIVDNGELIYSTINLGTPDHVINSSFLEKSDSSITAKHGIAVGGIVCDPHGADTKRKISKGEYFQTKLKSPLKKDSLYILKFHMMLNPNSKRASNGIGIKFSECVFNPFDSLHMHENILPNCDFSISEDIIMTKEWQEFEFQYKASGKEEYFTIGLFENKAGNKSKWISGGNLPYAYYLIDLISLQKLSTTNKKK